MVFLSALGESRAIPGTLLAVISTL